MSEEVKERPQIRTLTIKFIKRLESEGVNKETLSSVLGIQKSAIYNWVAPNGVAIPTKMGFVRLYGMSVTPPETLPIVIVAVRTALENQHSGNLLSSMVSTGMVNSSGVLTGSAMSVLGATSGIPMALGLGLLGPIGWLASAGITALIGKKFVKQYQSKYSKLDIEQIAQLPSRSINAFYIDPSKTWSKIITEVTSQENEVLS